MLRMPSDTLDTLVWITGASSGIGAALAAALPFDDAHVVDISRSGGAPRAEHLAADLSDPASWFAVEAHLVSRLGGTDARRAVFVHSAGTIQPIGFAGQVDSAAYRANVLLNAAAPMALGHGFLRAVGAFQGQAHLYLLSSGAASRPYPGWSSYGGGKAAVNQWVRAVGEEQRLRAERGLPSCRVISVTPGVTATGMQELIRPTDPADFPAVERFRGLHVRGELRDPADVARDIWSLVDRDLDTGTVIDLRDLS
jgi:NAD(P)-dependent dehydrogenase (short-subunit alcohol dehydrogenase family)